MATFFGKNTAGALTFNVSTYCYSDVYTLTENAVIDAIYWYGKVDAGTGKGTCALYDDSVIGSVRLGVTNEVTGIDTTAKWRKFTFPSTITRTPADYTLGVELDVPGKLYYTANVDKKFRIFDYVTYPDYPNPVTWTELTDWDMSIYATYTAPAEAAVARQYREIRYKKRLARQRYFRPSTFPGRH